jgi:7-cyano-7-deazaguanine synthase
MKKVLLCSSGIDSHSIQYLIKPDVMVYFDTGQSLCKKEIQSIKSQDYGDDVIVDSRFRLNDTVLDNDIVPNRNAYFVLGGTYYGDEIILNSTAGDTTHDKDEPFVEKINELIKHMFSNKDKNPSNSLNGATLTTPFIQLTKTQLVKKYLDEGGSSSSLLKTRSCYSDEDIECGKCRSCIRKYVALKLNGLDSTWNVDPSDNIQEAYDYALKNNRKEEIKDLKRCLDMNS